MSSLEQKTELVPFPFSFNNFLTLHNSHSSFLLLVQPHEIEFEEIKMNYDLVLGEGAFGKVFAAVWNGHELAVKECLITNAKDIRKDQEIELMS